MEQWLKHVEKGIGDLDKWVRNLPPEQVYTAILVLFLTVLFLILGKSYLMDMRTLFTCFFCSAFDQKLRDFVNLMLSVHLTNAHLITLGNS